MRAAVLGSRGAVGSRVVALLTQAGHDVVRVGRDRASADVVLDLGASDLNDFTALTSKVDVTVNTSGLERVQLATASAAPFVDISATSTYFAALERARPQAGALLSVGLAPGITTLMAAEITAEPGDAVDVALVLGEGERHGAAAIAWTVGLLGATFTDPASGRSVRNLTEPRVMGPTGARRRYLRADFPDAFVVGAERQLAVRNHLALSSPAATLALQAATWLPKLGAPMMSLHLPGSDEWRVFVQNRRSGEYLEARGREQSVITAAVTAFAAEHVVRAINEGRFGMSRGVHHLHSLTTLADVAAHTGIEVRRGTAATLTSAAR